MMTVKPLQRANKYSTRFSCATLDKYGSARHSGWIVAYCSHPFTREYLCATMEFLCTGARLPAHSYQDKPDLPDDNMALIRSLDGQHWEAVMDLRGKIGYRVSDGSVFHIDSLAELPASITLCAPRQATDTWNGAQWIAALPSTAIVPINYLLPMLRK